MMLRTPSLQLVLIAFVIATCWLFALANVVLVTQQWEFNDIHAYLGAARRLMEGGSVYAPTADASELYRYSPWFAVLWIPLTQLPTLVVEVAWAIILIGATFMILLKFRDTWAAVALALLLGALVYRTAGWGNVQPAYHPGPGVPAAYARRAVGGWRDGESEGVAVVRRFRLRLAPPMVGRGDQPGRGGRPDDPGPVHGSVRLSGRVPPAELLRRHLPLAVPALLLAYRDDRLMRSVHRRT